MSLLALLTSAWRERGQARALPEWPPGSRPWPPSPAFFTLLLRGVGGAVGGLLGAFFWAAAAAAAAARLGFLLLGLGRGTLGRGAIRLGLGLELGLAILLPLGKGLFLLVLALQDHVERATHDQEQDRSGDDHEDGPMRLLLR